MGMSEAEQIALLTSAEAGELLDRAVADAHLDRWEVHAVHHRPGAGVSVGYTITVTTPEGRSQNQYLCATTARLSDPGTPGLVHFENPDSGLAVHLWRHPADPELPALPDACDHAAVSRLLGHPVHVKMVAYRPTRRSVLKAVDSHGTAAFLKVVRPKTLPDLVRRHTLLAAAGVPVPHVLAQDPRGLVALTTARGVPLANYLSSGLADPAATLRAAIGTLDAMPAGVVELPRHPSWAERVDYYAHAAGTALPDQEVRARAVAGEVTRVMRASDPGPVQPTHGDFYEANLFFDSPTHVATLLDVDAVGPGHRVDDLACMLGHVSVLPHLAPQSYPHVPAILDTWWRLAAGVVDARALAARAAAVALSLVAGAKKPQSGSWRADALGRLAEAERWLELARPAS